MHFLIIVRTIHHNEAITFVPGYPDRIIKQTLKDLTVNKREPSPEELVGQFFKRVTENDKPYGHVTLPYN